MRKIAIYRYDGTYVDENGETKSSTIVTVAKIPYAHRVDMVRLVADEGMALTKDGGETLLPSADVMPSEASEWCEVEAPEEQEQGE